MRIKFTYLFIVLALLAGINQVAAQGTAFIYQGRLSSGSAPATGSYDLAFTLYTTNVTGSAVAGPMTNSAVTVTNGLFTTLVDFGNAFTGTSNWLEIAVSTNGANSFTTLAPRQQITPTPYAIYSTGAGTAVSADTATTATSASSVAAANIVGTIAAGQLPASVVTNGTSGVNIAGTFTGNGGNLTNVNINALTQAEPPVVDWGNDEGGTITVPAGLSNVVAIAAGDFHGLALQDNGTVIGWGDNSYGQLNIPTGLSNVVAIAAGLGHSLALKGDGTTVGWGDNSQGETTIPVDLSNVLAIAAGNNFSLALQSNGTVVGFGFDDFGQIDIPAGLSNVVAIAAGDDFSLALRSNGTVVGWGIDIDGETTIPAGLSNVMAIAAGVSHSLARQNNGMVVGWGYNGFGQTNIPAGLINVVAIAAGYDDSLALQSNGIVVGWGYDYEGDTTIPAGLSNVVAIAAANTHSMALRPNIIGAPPALLTGNNVFAGSITATSFVGDGSGLNNLNISLSELPSAVVTNNASNVTLNGVFSGNGNGLILTNFGATTAYTPTIGDGINNFTMTVAQGYYTKVGGIIYVDIWLQWSSKGSANPASTLVISLPFPSASPRPTFSLGFVNGVTFGSQLTVVGGLGSSTVNLWSLNSGGSPTALTVANYAATGQIQLSGCYH